MEIAYDEMQPDEWEQVHRLRSAAFNGPIEPDPDFPRLETGHVLVAKANGTIVATAASADFDQILMGTPISMAGVTGVAVAPHVAGKGIAGGLVTRLLEGAAERSQPISALYPSTSAVYRSLGYESAGTWAEFEIPFRAVHSKAPEGVTVEEAGPEVYDLVHHLHDQQALRNHGWIKRSEWWWNRLQYKAVHPTTHQRIFVASDAGGPCAFAVVANTASTPIPVAIYDFKFEDLFGTPAGIQAIAATLSSYSTVAGRLISVLPTHELGSLCFRPELAKIGNRSTWMQRIVDVAQAMRSRPAGAFEGSIHLDITDRQLSKNNNRFVLTSGAQTSDGQTSDGQTSDGQTSDGGALAEVGGSGKITISIGDLSSIYTGFVTASYLFAAGRLSGADEQDLTNLDRCFGGRTPTMVDFF